MLCQGSTIRCSNSEQKKHLCYFQVPLVISGSGCITWLPLAGQAENSLSLGTETDRRKQHQRTRCENCFGKYITIRGLGAGRDQRPAVFWAQTETTMYLKNYLFIPHLHLSSLTVCTFMFYCQHLKESEAKFGGLRNLQESNSHFVH